jgi:hypothetical protein
MIFLDEVLEKCFRDLNDAYCLIDLYSTRGARLFSNKRDLEKIKESQEDLIPNIIEKIKSLKFDIELIHNKTINGDLELIDSQNQKILSVFERYFMIKLEYNLNDTVQEVQELINEYISLIKGLKIKATDYNKKAEKLNKEKLKHEELWHTAYENIKNRANNLQKE